MLLSQRMESLSFQLHLHMLNMHWTWRNNHFQRLYFLFIFHLPLKLSLLPPFHNIILLAPLEALSGGPTANNCKTK